MSDLHDASRDFGVIAQTGNYCHREASRHTAEVLVSMSRSVTPPLTRARAGGQRSGRRHALGQEATRSGCD